MKSRRRWASVLVGGAVFFALLAAVVPSALSDPPPDQYTASIDPTSVVVGTGGKEYTLTITNSGPDNLGSANVTVPSGFTAVSYGSPTAPAGKTWTSGDNGSGVIELRASGTSNALAPTEAVSVVVTADASTEGQQTWETAADTTTNFANGGDFQISGSQPGVTITGSLAQFVVSAASPQTAGEPFDLTVTAEDSDGRTVGSYTGSVDFSSSDTGTSTVLPSSYSFTSGDAGVHTFTKGVTLTTAGSQTISVADTTADVSSTSASITVNPGALDHFNVAAPSTTTAGNAFDVTVTALDHFGNTKTDYAGTIHFGTTDTGSHTLLPGDYLFVPGDDGTHTFTGGVTLTKTPSQTVSVADASDPSKAGTSGSITVDPAPLDRFTLTNLSPAAPETAGSQFAVTVTALDPYDNPASGWTSTTDCVVFSGPLIAPDTTHAPLYPGKGTSCSTGQSELSFDASGQATANVTLFNASTSTDLTVKDAATQTHSGATGNFTVLPAVLDSFGWTSQPAATQVAGTVFPQTIQVTAYDAYGNVATNYDPTPAAFGGLSRSPSGCASDHTTVTPGGTSGCDPVYGFGWNNGVATSSTVTDFTAEGPLGLTVTDSSTNPDKTVTASSSGVTVAPAVLDHFKWGPQPASSQVAGAKFGQTITVTAYDAFGNVATNYDPTPATFGGLSRSPSGCASDHSTVKSGGTFGCDPIYGFSWSQGVATSTTVKDYAAETARLAVSDLSTNPDKSVSAQSDQFTVAPADLDHFIWTNQPTDPEKAGVAFSAAVTAYDAYGNVKTNYGGTNSFSGLGNSPRGCASDHTSVTLGGASFCSPVYGFSWLQGVATSSTVTDYKAEGPVTLTVKDGSVTGASSSFTVKNNEPDVNPYGVTFTVQPGLSLFNAPLTGPPTVFVQDPFGNPVPNRTVTMAIGPSSKGASTSFTGGSSTSAITGPAGTAQFTNLAIALASVNYTIQATVTKNPTGTVSGESSTFDVANDLKTCGSPTCQGGQATSDNLTFSTVTLTSTTGASLTGTLGTAVSTAITAPVSGTPCAGLGGQGFGVSIGAAGTAADFPSDATTKPTFTIVTRIDKSLVKRKPQPNGANNFDVCLGAINTITGLGLPNAPAPCANPQTDPSFPNKTGGCAVRATSPSGIDNFWAVLPDAPNGVKSCTDPKIRFPVVLTKTKNGAGDVVLTSCVPWPFDPHPFGGP